MCVLGSIFFAIGLFVLALARPTLRASMWLPTWGRFALGVYLCHFLVIWTFWSFRIPTVGSVFLFAVATYLLALGVTVVLSRLPPGRLLVTTIHKGPEASRIPPSAYREERARSLAHTDQVG